MAGVAASAPTTTPESTLHFSRTVMALAWLEIALLIAAAGTSAFRLWFVSLARHLHVNIRYLLMNQTYGVWIYALVKIPRCLNDATNGALFTNKFYADTAAFHRGLLLFAVTNNLCVAIERVFSTVEAKRYEKYNSSLAIKVAILAPPWLTSGAIVAILYYDIVTLSPCIVVGLVLNVAYMFGFLILLWYNSRQRRLTQALATLSTRFQIAENIKTTRMMLTYTFYGFVLHTIQIGEILYIVEKFYYTDHETYIIGACVFDIMTALRLLSDPLALYFSSSDFCKNFSKGKSFWKPKPRGEEQSVYFTQLQKQWQRVA